MAGQIFDQKSVRNTLNDTKNLSKIDKMGAPEIVIDREALEHNFMLHKRSAHDLPLAPVIKANAYGHGAVLIGKTLESLYSVHDLPFFCVARVSEARELRAAGVSRALLVLSYFCRDDLKNFPVDTELCLHCDEDVELLCSLSLSEKKKISGLHLNINTGMNRLGWGGDGVIRQITQAKTKLHGAGFAISGLMSHFARSEELSHEASLEQEKKFLNYLSEFKKTWTGDFPKWIHIANSSAVLNGLGIGAPFNLVRPGIHLWGVKHNSSQVLKVKLRPVLSLHAPLRQIFWVPKGVGVGYGHRFVCEKKTLIGTLCLGYADGISRRLSRKSSEAWKLGVVVEGERVPIAGTVSMDLIMVDLTEHSRARSLVGKSEVMAEWIGPTQGVESHADGLDTISYEVLCALSHRLHRRLKGVEEERNGI